MSKNEQEQIETLNKKIDNIIDELENIKNTLNPKPKYIKVLLVFVTINILVLGIGVPLFTEHLIDNSLKQIEDTNLLNTQMNNVEFTAISNGILTSNNSMNIFYNIKGTNYYNGTINRDVFLTIDFGKTKIRMTNYTANVPLKYNNNKDNLIQLVWNLIPAKVNNVSGELNCNLEIAYNGSINGYYPPKPTILIEPFGLKNVVYSYQEPKINFDFKIGVQKGIVSNKDMNITYNFTAMNYNDFVIQKKVTLNITFYLDNIVVTNFTSNIPITYHNITNDSIGFSWAFLPAKKDNTSGAIYFTISLHRYLKKGDIRTISNETIPYVKVWLESFGSMRVDLQSFF